MEGKCDMFVKVSDKRDIVDFVKEIEKYPCLYDRTLPEYANKVYNRRAWSIIAKKINTTVPDCRDKWRKIRISYMRSLKQHMSDKPPMRPYYLSEELQFIRPFLKITPLKTNNSIKKEERMDIESPISHKRNISDSDSSDMCESDIIEDEPDINRTQDVNRVNIKEKPNSEVVYVKENNRNSFNEEKNHTRNYADVKESNARKMFLLSLLPDVECFTESEMRIFRRKVIDACDEIINRHVI